MQIHGLADDFIKVHGSRTIMYSRITRNSSTRIDYVLSNTNKCSDFQYLDMGMGLDHKSIFAKYDIELVVKKEPIPREKFYSGWVISKQLQNDELFMESCKEVFEAIQNEDRDPSFKWLKMKVAIEGIAREREKQMKKEQNKKLEVLQGFYGSIIDDMCKGIDCAQEFDQVVSKMNHFYEERLIYIHFNIL